jgi:hypothetical protein
VANSPTVGVEIVACAITFFDCNQFEYIILEVGVE